MYDLKRPKLTLDHAADVLHTHDLVFEQNEHYGGMDVRCTCGEPVNDGSDYTAHVLKELAKGAR